MIAAFLCIGDRPHAKYAVASFKKNIPNATLVQVTDLKSPVVEGVDEFYRMSYDGELMLAMFRGYASIAFDDILITFADDCILDRPIDYLFKGDYDVAIVKRDDFLFKDDDAVKRGVIKKFKHQFPYTNGLVIVKNKQFYRDCYKRLTSMKDEIIEGRKASEWWGDMAVIKAIIEEGKYKVKLLPEKIFCMKPESDGEGSNGISILWHYAGENRKPWMENHGAKVRGTVL